MNTSTSTIPTIGIIGGIGSGKSTIASMFHELGCIVADADENIATILRAKEVQEQLAAWWGNEILVGGNLNRAAISRIVFGSDQERKRLESYLHPRARTLQEEQFSRADSSTKALVIDAPLLLESGLDALCNCIIYVDVELKTRLARVKKSRNWDEQELLDREATQIPLDKKREKADYVVTNEGDLDAVLAQVKQILEDIRRQPT